MIRGSILNYRYAVRNITPMRKGGLNPGALGLRFARSYSDQPPMDAYEQKIFQMLQESFQPQNLEVRDVSGGCGSMFAILVESDKFNGIPMIKQHRLVNDALKDEISKWHGLQLRTKSHS